MDWSNSTMSSAWIFHNSSSKTVSQISWVYLHFIPLHPDSGGQKAASILHPFFPPLAKWTKNRRLCHNSLWIFDPPLSSPFGVGGEWVIHDHDSDKILIPETLPLQAAAAAYWSFTRMCRPVATGTCRWCSTSWPRSWRRPHTAPPSTTTTSASGRRPRRGPATGHPPWSRPRNKGRRRLINKQAVQLRTPG